MTPEENILEVEHISQLRRRVEVLGGGIVLRLLPPGGGGGNFYLEPVLYDNGKCGNVVQAAKL